jgi:predicted PurR-regulated permease PerM
MIFHKKATPRQNTSLWAWLLLQYRPMQTKTVEKLFFFGLLLATLIFTFLLFRPFLAVLVLGISFAIVLHPVHEWLKRGRLPSWLSALLTVFIFIIVLCGPLLFIGRIVFNQSQDVYRTVVSEGSAKPFLDTIETKVNAILPDMINLDINEKTSEFISYVSDNIANIFRETLAGFFSFLLMILIIFYFLKDGAEWKRALVVLSPLGDKDDEKIISRLALSVNAVIKGSLFVALVQGILMGIGLTIFHVPNPALWGVVAAMAAFLPMIGTSLVSGPAIIYLLYSGNTGAAIGLLIWATLAVGLIDNFLSPHIVGKKIKLPSLMVLFSVLGGISLLGPVGILIGPLTISLLYTLISIYRDEFKQNAIL